MSKNSNTGQGFYDMLNSNQASKNAVGHLSKDLSSCLSPNLNLFNQQATILSHDNIHINNQSIPVPLQDEVLSLQLDGQTSSKNATFGKVGLNPKINSTLLQQSLKSPIEAASP